MSFELSSLGKEFKKKFRGGGKESKIWNYIIIHPWFKNFITLGTKITVL